MTMFRSTYETAPVFALMERVVLSKMRQYVGWTDGEGDGILAPGLYVHLQIIGLRAPE